MKKKQKFELDKQRKFFELERCKMKNNFEETNKFLKFRVHDLERDLRFTNR